MQKRHKYPVGRFDHVADKIDVPSPSLMSVFRSMAATPISELILREDGDALHKEIEKLMQNGGYREVLKILERRRDRRNTSSPVEYLTRFDNNSFTNPLSRLPDSELKRLNTAIRHDNYRKAIQILSRLRNNESSEHVIDYLTGILCWEAGLAGDALDAFEKSIAVRDSPEVLFAAGETAAQLDDHDLAGEYLKRAFIGADKPLRWQVRIALSHVYLGTGRCRQAQHLLPKPPALFQGPGQTTRIACINAAASLRAGLPRRVKRMIPPWRRDEPTFQRLICLAENVHQIEPDKGGKHAEDDLSPQYDEPDKQTNTQQPTTFSQVTQNTFKELDEFRAVISAADLDTPPGEVWAESLRRHLDSFLESNPGLSLNKLQQTAPSFQTTLTLETAGSLEALRHHAVRRLNRAFNHSNIPADQLVAGKLRDMIEYSIQQALRNVKGRQ